MPSCHKCGASLPQKAKFCSECGNRQLPPDSAADPLLGQQLGAYRIVSLLSEGGMGRVYRAEQLSLGRLVCIKTLLPNLVEETSMVRRFEQEARATSALRHPNIVDVLDFGSSRSQLYIVMELVDGEDLAQLLSKRGSLPWALAVELTRQILSALGEAHGAGIVHRDLKPANVLVTKLRDGSDVAKVTDFGIAKLIDDKGTRITATGAMFGTPHYMAPEQIQGGDLDARANIYAAGVMLFELLTGEDLFPGETPQEVFRGHLNTPARSPSKVAAHPIPPQLDTIVLKAVAKAREDRFPNALAFQRALETLRGTSTALVPVVEKATAVVTPQSARSRALHKLMPEPLANHVNDLQALLAGEKRNVTVLFADISNFTSMAETMSAEQLRALMNRCFDGMVEAVARYDGSVDKFMGDCMMAVFGAPQAHEDDPERAVRAAIDALRYLEEVNRTLPKKVGMRIGIHAGEVFAGGVGGARRMDYTVMGDVVNVAQRLQTHARIGAVLVSKQVRNATKAAVEYRALEPLEVKGKSEPLDTFEVIRLADDDERQNSASLVGRERELAKVKKVLAYAARERAAGALLVGPAGIGKTRLLQEAVHWARRAKLTVAQARAGRLGRRSYLDSIRQLLTAVGGGESLTGLLSVGVAARTVERLRHLVGGTTLPGRFDPEDNRKMNRAAVEEALQQVWLTSGLCIIVDDAHLLDPASLALLEQLLTSGNKRRFALILAARSGDTAALLPKLPRLELKGLSPADIVRVARGELGLDALPQSVAQLLAERSDGNPLVAIEVMRTLIDHGNLVLRRGQWELAGQIDPRVVPIRLAGMITARTDVLSDAARRFLRMAAVAGRSFNVDHVARALGAHIDTTAVTDEAGARGFVVRTEQTRRFMFPQAMVHDALVNAISDVDRRQLHLALGQALEANTGSLGEVSYDALAHHYMQAGKARHANRYLVASANAAMKNLAYDDAADKLRKALSLILNEVKKITSPSQQQAAYVFDIAQKLIAALSVSTLDQAIRVVDRVLPHVPAHLAPTPRAKMLREHAAALIQQSDAREAQRYLEMAHQLLANNNEPEALARVYSDLSAALEAQGNLSKATDVLVEGFRMVAGGAPNDPDLLWQYLNQLGRLHLRSGQADRAARFFENALEHAQRAGNTSAQARIVSNQGSLRAQRGDYASAQQLLERSLRFATESGDVVAEARGHYNLGRLRLALGQREAAREHLQRSAKLSRKLGFHEGLAAALNALDGLKSKSSAPPPDRTR